VAVVLPVAHANPRSVGDVGRGRLRTINLVRRAGRPPTLYIAQRQGPTVYKRMDAPDQGTRQGVGRVVGLAPLEINLTFSPLISSLLLTLYFTLYSFHHGSVHRACFIITAQLPIESDSHYTLFYFETNSITFGPLMIQES
jgi:hypothetical protein